MRILVQEPPPVDLTAADAAGWGNASGYRPNRVRRSPRPIAHERFGMGRGAMGHDATMPRAARTSLVYNEESADPVYPPVPVEVQGIIYIYNPPARSKGG